MKGKLRTIYKSMFLIGICLTLIGVITVAVQANVSTKQITYHEIHQAGLIDGESRAVGTISGEVLCLGFISDATNVVFVDLHTDVTLPPVDTIHISCNQLYQFPDVPDGTYYIGSWLDENDSGGGPPDSGEPTAWYGDQDPIVISSETPSHTDVNIDLARYIERVSLFNDGAGGLEERDWDSYDPSISGDGRYVVFNTWWDYIIFNRGVYIFDRELNITTHFSTNDPRAEEYYKSPDISADGNYVSLAYNDDLFYYTYELLIKEWAVDPENLTVIEPWETNSPYFDKPSISGDGCRVAFEFEYGDTLENYARDIYLYDCNTEDTTLISVAMNGTGSGNGQSYDPAISDDGLFVAFKSRATDLVDPPPTITGNLIYVRDIEAGITELIPLPEGISGGDFNDAPSISADGRYVAFEYNYEVFVHDRKTGGTRMISLINGEPSGDSEDPSISGDGRFVTYTTYRQDENESWFGDIFVNDLETGTIKMVTKGFEGQPEKYSGHPVISANGRFIAFRSDASDLVVDDNNGTKDVFVYANEPALTVDILGPGTVNIDPEKSTYNFKEVVTLTPIADEGYVFDSWTGADAADLIDNNDGTWSITMDDDKSITANFKLDVFKFIIYLPMILK